MPSPTKQASLLKMFLIFFKIGAFTFGGAYAMIPLIRRELVEKQGWIGDEEFLDGLAASQSSPGPIAANMSIYLGYRLHGAIGVFVSLLGTILPSFITILVIAMLFDKISDLEITKKVFHGLKPAVVALIVVPVIQMSRSAGIKAYNIWFPALAAILVGYLGISPIYLIVITILYAITESRVAARRAREASNADLS